MPFSKAWQEDHFPGRADEVHQMADEVHQMADEVHQMADEVHQMADEVHQMANEVDQMADEVDQMADEIDQMADEVDQIPIAIDQLQLLLLFCSPFSSKGASSNGNGYQILPNNTVQEYSTYGLSNVSLRDFIASPKFEMGKGSIGNQFAEPRVAHEVMHCFVSSEKQTYNRHPSRSKIYDLKGKGRFIKTTAYQSGDLRRDERINEINQCDHP